jgi:hypothetical protein
MVTGERYMLKMATLALETINGKRIAVTVPADATIRVVSEPSDGGQLLDVLWEGRVVAMFSIDVDRRGIEIAEHDATA